MKKFLSLLAAGALTLTFMVSACGKGATVGTQNGDSSETDHNTQTGGGNSEAGGSGAEGTPVATALGLPKETSPLPYEERLNMDPALRVAERDFAARFTAASVNGTRENLAVSPVSVFLALGLAAECSAGTTKEEILTALKIDGNTLKKGYADFYRSIIAAYTDDEGKVASCVNVTNSVWLDSHVEVKPACISSLSDNYFCYSYAADFMRDNKGANRAVRDFVKEQTRGLIDRDFQLSSDTLFSLINTLYLKDLWGKYGDDLEVIDKACDFLQGDGSVKKCNLLRGNYSEGRVYEGETFTHFYTSTSRGYKLKFIVPKDGHTLDEVFTKENLALIADFSDYHARDEEKNTVYMTRCLFPEFMAEYDRDVKPILYDFGIKDLFSEQCDFSPMTDEVSFCKQVKHVAKLNVDRKGIEGAAVTVMQAPGDAGPQETTYVYSDFAVDRAFGFVLTDPFNTVLFSGAVNFLG